MLFLAVFLPFGVSNYNPRHQYSLEFFSVLSVFMLSTIAIALLNEFFIKPLLIRDFSWKNFLLWSVWLLVILGLTNFLTYNFLGEWHDFSFASAIDFTFNCATVFIFPLAGTFFYFRYQGLKIQIEKVNKKSLQTIDGPLFLHFTGDGNNERFSIALPDFLFAEAHDNYVALNYIRNQEVKSELMRISMKRLLENIESDLIVRCHRSFIVNLYNVQSFKKGRNPEIRLKYVEDSIPVSKSYQSEILIKLSSEERRQ